jgi:hypothetical protein
MPSLQINARLLKAIACATSKDETRFYLKGVCIDFESTGYVLTGTDGHKLLCAKQDYQDAADAACAGQRQIIIPSELIDLLKPKGRSPDNAVLSFPETDSALQWRLLTLAFAGASYSQAEVEGSFPAARRVVPTEISREPATFDPRVLYTFTQAQAALGMGKDSKAIPRVLYNGGNPALVDWLPAGFIPGAVGFGVAMPFRAGDEMISTGWFTGTNAYFADPEKVAARKAG